MTSASLKSYSQKDLAQMAKQGGVRGWHTMRKDQLVKALLTASRSKVSKARTSKKVATPVARAISTKPAAAASHRKPVAPPRKPTSPRVLKHLAQVKAKLNQSKNLATPARGKNGSSRKDRVVVMVRDAYWLHVVWELTSQSIDRVQAAMGQDWHMARPILRLVEVAEGGTTSASERVHTDVDIHGGVSNWYLHIDGIPKSYRVEIGYVSATGKFSALCRSNVVNSPEAGSSDAVDQNWSDVAQNFDKIYALSGGYSTDGSSTELQELFEERLRRPMNSPNASSYGDGVSGLLATPRRLKFEVDAELIVFGATKPNARVTLRGEPVKLRPDGSFTVRMSLPNQRQVIPVVASSPDGSEQRTIVLALERNTKVMEPVVRESSET
jgi:uncharacterized protein